MIIHTAEPGDIPAILLLYNHAIRETTAAWVSREETLDDRQAWFEGRRKQDLPVLIASAADGTLLGFASYGPFRPREGYRLTAEHTVYVDPKAQRRGVGKALLLRLLDMARAQGLHVLVGAVDGQNKASIGLHEALGFEVTGRLPQVGTKFGRWLDLVFMTKVLTEEDAPEG
ncbi:N-acetyltransferase family protein [Roseibium sp.]|uniref:GNAT family N-acetyltransferase n=2 Tax=Roseibium sp. TaxID=1936156 RepID=UPI003263E823